MPRGPRLQSPMGVYHITCRGNNKQRVFFTDDDRSFYLALIRRLQQMHSFMLYHYVLMSNHVHLIIHTTLTGSSISDIMKVLNLTYTQRIMRTRNYSGHLWQDRFKSKIIKQDAYLLKCGLYLELNPVRARMTKQPEEYAWSSYRFYRFSEKSDFLQEDPFYSGIADTLPERRRVYREYMEYCKAHAKEIKESIMMDIIGDSAFRAQRRYELTNSVI